MIKSYIHDLALQAGVQLSDVSVNDGRAVGVSDAYLVHLSSNGQRVSTLVYEDDLDSLRKGLHTERMALRIRNALSRLKLLMEG